jgi:hypothetical protein
MKLKFGIKTIISLLVVSSLTSLTHAKPEQCEDLVDYRDTQLIKDFDKASKKLTMAQDSLNLLRKVQTDTQIVAEKQPTINKVFQLVLSVKTVNSAIASILKLSPQTGAIMESAGNANKWVERVVKVSEDIDVLDAISNSKIENYLFWEAVGSTNTLGSAVKSVHEFTENILEHKEQYKDGEEIVESLQQHLRSLDKELLKAQQRVANYTNTVNAINNFKNIIDKQCK